MSLFGNTTNNNQSKSLFGSTPTASTSSPFSFGATNTNNTASQPQQGGSLFGSTSNNTTQPAQSGGLFGSNAQSQQQQTGSSLFGNTLNNTNSSNQQLGGGLFGSTPTAQSQPQQTNSLFGGQGTTNNNNGGNSLFGNTTTQNNTQNKPTLSLFGNTSNTPTQRQQSQQQPSLFGASTTTRPGGLTLGQSTTQPQTQPGVKIDLSQLRGTTRFNDLHEDLQSQITLIDTFITSQIAFREQCDALMPSHQQNLSTVPADVEFVRGKLETTELALDNDSRAIEGMKELVKRDAENARLSFRAVENLKLPQQFHYQGMWGQTSSSPSRTDDASTNTSTEGPADLVSYVSGKADGFQATLGKYQGNIEEIEAHLRTLETAVVQQGQQIMFQRGQDGRGRSRNEQVRELVATLTAFENGILGTARKVGEAREGLVGVVESGAGGSEAAIGRFGRR